MIDSSILTFCMTCYRDGEYLIEAWNSILQQNDKRWKCVLVKDGGADRETTEIFKALKHPNLIKFELYNNVGHFKAINKAIEVAGTEYIFKADADDKVPDYLVKEVLNLFTSNKKIDFIYGDYQYIDENGSLGRIIQFSGRPDIKTTVKESLPGVFAIKKSAWRMLGGFIGNTKVEELDFNLRLFDYKCNLKHCGKVLYFYRQHEYNRLSKSFRYKALAERKKLTFRHKQIFSNINLKNEFLRKGSFQVAREYAFDRNYRFSRKYAIKSFKLGMWKSPVVIFMMLSGRDISYFYNKIKYMLEHLVFIKKWNK